MYTKEVENLKVSQILRLVENTIENNLSLYISAIITLAVVSNLVDIIAGDNIYYYAVLLMGNAIINWAVKVFTLKTIKTDKLENSLITSRAKKGNIFKQGLIYALFYIVITFVLVIVAGIFSVAVSVIVLTIPALTQIIELILVFVGAPLVILFSLFMSAVSIEIFCKDEKSKFITSAFTNIFKSKNRTLNKLMLGLLMLLIGSMIISLPIAIPQANTFALILTSILASCLGVIGWTYTYIVYMTSITGNDLIEVQDNQNSQSNKSDIVNQNSDEITKLW